MELTLREKIALQRQIKENLNTLKAGVANLRERIALQRKIKEDLDKLRGISTTTQTEKSEYQKLLDGAYNSLAPLDFFEKAKQICDDEINARWDRMEDRDKIDIDLARIPVYNYCAQYYDSATDSMKKAA